MISRLLIATFLSPGLLVAAARPVPPTEPNGEVVEQVVGIGVDAVLVGLEEAVQNGFDPEVLELVEFTRPKAPADTSVEPGDLDSFVHTPSVNGGCERSL